MSPREAHKQLLIVESELNRTLLKQEAENVGREIGALADRLRSTETVTRLVFEFITHFGQDRPKEEQEQRSALRGFLRPGNLFRLATGAWRIYRTWRKRR